jgi:hypothetical protein
MCDIELAILGIAESPNRILLCFSRLIPPPFRHQLNLSCDAEDHWVWSWTMLWLRRTEVMLAITGRRLLVFILAAVLLLWFSRRSTSPAQSHPDDKNDKSSARHAFSQRLVAVGDLHGGKQSWQQDNLIFQTDISNAHKVLQMSSITTKSEPGKWAAGQDILVQTGDMVDRGTYMIDLYKLFQSLRGQAEGQGGRVVSILGNHEMMNAIGDYR